MNDSQRDAARSVRSANRRPELEVAHDPCLRRKVTAAHASTCPPEAASPCARSPAGDPSPAGTAIAAALVSRSSRKASDADSDRFLSNSSAMTPVTSAVAMESPEAKS